VWVVSFVDRTALPIWFTVWLDRETLRTMSVRLTTASHFMTQRYAGFNRKASIEPPS
jgi:hypothetical protein